MVVLGPRPSRKNKELTVPFPFSNRSWSWTKRRQGGVTFSGFPPFLGAIYLHNVLIDAFGHNIGLTLLKWGDVALVLTADPSKIL